LKSSDPKSKEKGAEKTMPIGQDREKDIGDQFLNLQYFITSIIMPFFQIIKKIYIKIFHI
jgi:hypothetical protein